MPSDMRLEPGHEPKLQIRVTDMAQLVRCDTLLYKYKHELNGFRRSRSYAGTFAALGIGGMAWGGQAGGGAGGAGVLGGATCLWVSYKCFIRMTEYSAALSLLRQQFINYCTEPWTEAVKEPAPVQVPQVAARQWALPESVRESLRKPIVFPEIGELKSETNFVSQNSTAIAYGAGAAVCAGAAIAIVALNWTGIAALLDPVVPPLAAAFAAWGARSAQLFAW